MTNKENMLKMLLRQRPEWVPCWRDSCDFIPCSAIEDRAKGGTGADWFGVPWIDMTPAPGGTLLEEVSGWREAIRFPDLEAVDWAAAAEADLAGADRENKVLWIPLFCGLFERLHSFLGFENALVALCEEPEETQALIDAYCDFKLREIDKVITYYHPEVVCMHDDYGMKSNMLLSPDMWRRFFKEPLRRINDYCTGRNTIFVLHCCGKVDPIVGDFVDLGITAWDSVNYCNDLPELYRKYGRELSFTTSLDMPFLAAADEAQVRQHVREAIDMLGTYGNMSPRDDAPTIPQRTLDIVADETRAYGREYYIRHPIPEE